MAVIFSGCSHFLPFRLPSAPCVLSSRSAPPGRRKKWRGHRQKLSKSQQRPGERVIAPIYQSSSLLWGQYQPSGGWPSPVYFSSFIIPQLPADKGSKKPSDGLCFFSISRMVEPGSLCLAPGVFSLAGTASQQKTAALSGRVQIK